MSLRKRGILAVKEGVIKRANQNFEAHSHISGIAEQQGSLYEKKSATDVPKKLEINSQGTRLSKERVIEKIVYGDSVNYDLSTSPNQKGKAETIGPS